MMSDQRRRPFLAMAFCVVVASASTAFATDQVCDKLVYGGHTYGIFQVPMLGLWHYGDGELPKGKSRPPAFESNSSANWIGYRAKWQIRDGKLWLRTIRGRLNGKDVQDERILPGSQFPVNATWFSGTIHLYVGDWNADTSEYESAILFKIDQGLVKSVEYLASEKINLAWNGMRP